MEKASKSELLTTIETQQDKLRRYEAKMRDLISAYKSTVNENEALKSSLAALTMVPKETSSADDGGKKKEENKSSSCDTQSDLQNEMSATVHDDNKSSEKLNMLTTSLMTLTQEKTKMEASYQSEIKKLRQEAEEKERKTTEEKTNLDKKIQTLEAEVQELKKKLKGERAEREKEQNDHGLMIREMQKLVTTERMAKEHIEQQLHDVKLTQAEREQAHTMTCRDFESRITALNKELLKQTDIARSLEVKGEQPSQLSVDLQAELARCKEQQRIAVGTERARTAELESRLHASQQQHEESVGALEARLAELSANVAQSERLRQQDIESIRRLREQTAHLTTENNTLSALVQQQQQHVGKSITEIVADDLAQATDAQTLLTKMLRLKDVIRESCRRFEGVLNSDLLEDSASLLGLSSEKLHAKCQQQLDDLREEYERYKLRAQSILKTKGSKPADGPSQKEYDQLRVQSLEWREKVQQLRAERDDLKTQLSEGDRQHSQTIAAMAERQKAQLVAADNEYKAKMGELEAEVRRHRERTVALLAEKDQEIESLRLETQYVNKLRQLTPTPLSPVGLEPSVLSAHNNEAAGAASSEEASAVSELLTRTPIATGSLKGMLGGENPLLHFAQEQARKDVEISSLYKQKRGVEQALRELQQSVILKDERHAAEVERLAELVDRYERSKSRENANLEYLKNVVYQYMVAHDRESRQRMLNAIATILQFNPREKLAVQEHLQGGMWLSSYSKRPTS